MSTRPALSKNVRLAVIGSAFTVAAGWSQECFAAAPD